MSNQMSEQVANEAIKVGSRKSQLALIQTNEVINQLKAMNENLNFEIVSMETIGDKVLDISLPKIGEKNLFTKELEAGLSDGSFSFIVHSLKDLPTSLPDGLTVAAICKRENPQDVVILHRNYEKFNLKSLPQNSVLGTSSLRRSAQLKRNFPHLKFKDVRGNLNTRLRKLDEAENYSGLVLAAAGVLRMGWSNRISHFLGPDECLYAVGQGALAVECRENDKEIIKLLSQLYDTKTLLCCVAERAFLYKLKGGCSVPVGVDTDINSDNEIVLKGGVFSLDGQQCISDTKRVKLSDNVDVFQENSANKLRKFCGILSTAENHEHMVQVDKLGTELASSLLNMGADKILSAARATIQQEINLAPRNRISN